MSEHLDPELRVLKVAFQGLPAVWTLTALVGWIYPYDEDQLERFFLGMGQLGYHYHRPQHDVRQALLQHKDAPENIKMQNMVAGRSIPLCVNPLTKTGLYHKQSLWKELDEFYNAMGIRPAHPVPTDS